jgi:hypothetical protein
VCVHEGKCVCVHTSEDRVKKTEEEESVGGGLLSLDAACENVQEK